MGLFDGIGSALNVATLGITQFGGQNLTSSLGNFTGANQSASAAQSAAEASAQQASDALAFQKQTQADAKAIAAPSPEQLLSISSQYANASNFMSTQMQNLQLNYQLLSATQPALQEAGIQAYNLMTGQEATVLKPLQQQQALQRNQLENSLRDRLGSGYATTSAGMEALSQFDQQSQVATAQAQQNSLSLMLGTTLAAQPNMVNLANSVYSTGGNLSAQANSSSINLANSQVSAIEGTQPNFQNVINTAGAPYVGANIQGQSQQSIVNTLLGVGMGAGLKSMGNQTAPAPAPAA